MQITSIDNLLKFSKEKDLSVGTIITDGTYVLMGHSTGNDFWDLPKGRKEEHESLKNTAMREMAEEFGLSYPEDLFIEIGPFKYTTEKNLFLYMIIDPKLEEVDLNDLHCTSTFKKKNKELKEIDDYKLISIKEIDDYILTNLGKILKEVLTKYFPS